jgi:hypothetical protein
MIFNIYIHFFAGEVRQGFKIIDNNFQQFIQHN